MVVILVNRYETTASIPPRLAKRISGGSGARRNPLGVIVGASIVFLVIGLAIGYTIYPVINQPVVTPEPQPTARVIEIHGKIAEDGGWNPATIELRAGENYVFRIYSDDVVHGFGIPELGVSTGPIPVGQYFDVSVRFDRPGTYAFLCTVYCSPKHDEMVGTIVVR